MEQELEYLDQMMEEMETRYGYRAEELEYGPGFYVPYFQSDEEVDDEALLDAFSRMLDGLRFQGTVTLEVGRYLAAYCGYYLTRIVDQKINKGQRYGIVDGGNPSFIVFWADDGNEDSALYASITKRERRKGTVEYLWLSVYSE